MSNTTSTRLVSNTTSTRLGAAALRRIAVKADSDPRTVTRYLRGETGWPSTDRRIAAALAEEGIRPNSNPPPAPAAA